MENDILDSLNDIGYSMYSVGYEGPLSDEKALLKAIEGGPKSLEYTKLVHILSEELKKLFNLEESVNMMKDPEESSSFLLELSSFLKELGCPYKKLVTGYMSSRLQTKEDRILLLDYLLSELMAARMVKIDCPKEKPGSAMEIVVQESPIARDLKDILISLKFKKPPPNITVEMLFSKLEAKLKETIQKGEQLIGKPLYSSALTENDWKQLEATFTEMYEEYRLRKEMLITRLECTIQSFEWADRLKAKKDCIQSTYRPKKEQLKTEPDVKLSDFLAARTSLLQVEKTSSARVRKYTQSDVSKVIIGQVPDRGGLPNEQQPLLPEMPSWQQRSAPAGGRGCGGGRVPGGYNQGVGDHRPQTSPATFSQQNQHGYQPFEVPPDGYNQSQGYYPSQGGYNQNQGGYNPNQSGYNHNHCGYNRDYDSMGSYNQGISQDEDVDFKFNIIEGEMETINEILASENILSNDNNQGFSQGEDVDFKFNIIESEMNTINEILASENIHSNDNNSKGCNRSDSPQKWNESADLWSSDTDNVQDIFHRTIKQEPIDLSNVQEDNETSDMPEYNDDTICNVDQSYEANALIQSLNANMKVEIKQITKEIQDEIDSTNRGDNLENIHIKSEPGAEKNQMLHSVERCYTSNTAENITMEIKNRIDENIQNIKIKTEPFTEENQTKSTVQESSNKEFIIDKEIKEEIDIKVEPDETEDFDIEGVNNLNLKDRLVFASLQYLNSEYKPFALREDAYKPKLGTPTSLKDFFTNTKKIRFSEVPLEKSLVLSGSNNRKYKTLYSLLRLSINLMDAIQLCNKHDEAIKKTKVHAHLFGNDIICTPEQLKQRRAYFVNLVKQKYRKLGGKDIELLPESDIEDEALLLLEKDEILLTQRFTNEQQQKKTNLLEKDNYTEIPIDEYDVKPLNIKKNPRISIEYDIEITIKDTNNNKPLNEDDLTTVIYIIFKEADFYTMFFKPRFHDWFLRDDCIVLKCYNLESKKWLDSFISYCKPWPKADFRIVDFKVFTKRIFYTVTKIASRTLKINEYVLDNNEDVPGENSKISCTYLLQIQTKGERRNATLLANNIRMNANKELNAVILPKRKRRRSKRKHAQNANFVVNNSNLNETPKNIASNSTFKRCRY